MIYVHILTEFLTPNTRTVADVNYLKLILCYEQRQIRHIKTNQPVYIIILYVIINISKLNLN